MLTARLKCHEFRPVSFTKLYSKLYIMTELNANDVKFIAIDRQKLDLSEFILMSPLILYL